MKHSLVWMHRRCQKMLVYIEVFLVEALYFYGEGFGGAGQDTSSKQIDAKAL